MPKFSKTSADRLVACHPDLIWLFQAVIQGFDCAILCGHRGEAEQNSVFKYGKSKLPWPRSPHNRKPSMAVDAAPWPIDWHNLRRFYAFGGYVKGVAAVMGIRIRWGGDWDGDNDFDDQSFNDLVHFELVGGEDR